MTLQNNNNKVIYKYVNKNQQDIILIYNKERKRWKNVNNSNDYNTILIPQDRILIRWKVMKISFWSPTNGHNAVTSNLACISVMFSMMYQHKSIIIENHLQDNKICNLIKPRINLNHVFEDKNYYYRYTGMDSILYSLLRYNDIDNDNLVRMIENASTNIFGDYLFHISNNKRIISTNFELFMNNHISTILRACQAFADVTFVDTHSNNLSTQKVLQEADLVVVNLNQDKKTIVNFFKNYNSIISKSLFLINNYNTKSNHAIYKLFNSYAIDSFRIATVPYNHEYKDALNSGGLISFLIQNYKSTIEYENAFFINEIINATRMIHDYISFNINNRIIKEDICGRSLEELNQGLGLLF